MIQIDDLTVAYDDVLAIDHVDLAIEDGEFLTLVGPSGCGKTTLLRAVGGLQDPTGGRIRIDGDPPAAAQEHGDIGFVFQDHSLLPWKSALHNVTFLRRLAGKTPAPDAAADLLETMGLGGFEDANPTELSGGMNQRVAIARALHLGADVLLMDEPFGELDELTREEMGIEVRRIWRGKGKTVMFVTHSVTEAVFLADRCVVMNAAGRVIGTFEIDLPRPRDESVYESSAYHDQIAAIRHCLREGALQMGRADTEATPR